jgi:cytochrome P450
MIASLGPRIERVTDDLLDAIERKGSVDLVCHFAFPITVTIICELLGIPVEDQHLFRGWTALLARALDPSMNTDDAMDIVRAGDEAADAFGGYLTGLIDRRRNDPRDDLLTALIQASEGGDTLSHDELLASCLLLLVAGHETTTNLIGSGMLTLLRNPDQLALLRSDLSPESVRVAIEELLRYDPPVVAVLRVALEDVAIGRSTIPQGWDAILIIPGANRDPKQFTDPHRLNLRRTENRHLTFSGGPHFCLGAPLARLEGQIALTKLLKRFPKITLDTDEPEWRETITLRSLKALPVTVSTTV